jgi:hypothetical protein
MTTNDVFAYLKKKIKATRRIIRDKTILQKLITPYPKDRWMKDVENMSK